MKRGRISNLKGFKEEKEEDDVVRRHTLYIVDYVSGLKLFFRIKALTIGRTGDAYGQFLCVESLGFRPIKVFDTLAQVGYLIAFSIL